MLTQSPTYQSLINFGLSPRMPPSRTNQKPQCMNLGVWCSSGSWTAVDIQVTPVVLGSSKTTPGDAGVMMWCRKWNPGQLHAKYMPNPLYYLPAPLLVLPQTPYDCTVSHDVPVTVRQHDGDRVSCFLNASFPQCSQQREFIFEFKVCWRTNKYDKQTWTVIACYSFRPGHHPLCFQPSNTPFPHPLSPSLMSTIH